MTGKLFRAMFAAGYLVALLVGSAAPALADPAVPTEFKSHITGIEPATDDIAFEIVGGDAFIEMTVTPGHSVDVPGYFAEPYIQVDGNGTVSVNSRSPSKFINNDRFGTTLIPLTADAEAPPQWEVVGLDGTYVWHDHRTHWMNPNQPPGISGDVVEEVFAWEIPFSVDGTDHLVMGSLEWNPDENSVIPIAFGLAGLVAFATWRKGMVRRLALIAAIAAFAGVVLTFAEWAATPAAARTFPTAVLPPFFALVVLVAAAVVAGTRRVTAVQLIVVACVALMVFVFASFSVFTKPLLPSALPDAIERIATAAVAWVALAAGALAVIEMLALIGPSTNVDDATG